MLNDAFEKGLPRREGQYYFGDAGYGLSKWILTPCRGVRYHLRQWIHGEQQPQNPKELFNLRHAQVRNVIERIYGAVKKAFPVLSNMPTGYSIEEQVDIVERCFLAYSFRRVYKEFEYPDSFLEFNCWSEQDEYYTPEEDECDAPGDDAGEAAGDDAGDAAGDAKGDTAGDEAGADAGDAPGAAAGRAAGDAPGNATGDKAGEDAGDDAGDTPGDTAGDAAGDAYYAIRSLLKPLLCDVCLSEPPNGNATHHGTTLCERFKGIAVGNGCSGHEIGTCAFGSPRVSSQLRSSRLASQFALQVSKRAGTWETAQVVTQ